MGRQNEPVGWQHSLLSLGLSKLWPPSSGNAGNACIEALKCDGLALEKEWTKVSRVWFALGKKQQQTQAHIAVLQVVAFFIYCYPQLQAFFFARKLLLTYICTRFSGD